jgi:hypothetical protein
MGMTFNVTAEDILKSKIVDPPGWQHSVIADVQDAQAKTGVSGVLVSYRIVDGPNKGIIVDDRFWENAPGFIVNLAEALAGKKADGPMAFAATKEKLVGNYVDIEVKRGEFNNRPKNEIVGYKPFSGQKPAAAKPAGV